LTARAEVPQALWTEAIMNLKNVVAVACAGVLAMAVAMPAIAQGRGKAELKTASGAITIDYGRPSLKGRDMLSQLRDGESWRMGMNEATVIQTPVGLKFGATTVAKGSYSLFLNKSGETFQLVFNSQTGQWGTEHDPSKDLAKLPMTKAPVEPPVETFTIALSPAANGGVLELSWGAMKLSAPFETVK
jgi:hypothetical protein